MRNGAGIRTAHAVRRSYRVALACGALPLLVGVSIFVSWYGTRWSALVPAGLVTLVGGTALFLVGALSLVRFRALAARLPLARRPLRRATLGAAALLLANFPVAAGIVVAADAIATRYELTVHNATGAPLEDVRVHGGGCDLSLGSIPPGASVRRTFWIESDGSLCLRAGRGAAVREVTVDGYVTHGLGGRTVVTARPDGTFVIHDLDSPTSAVGESR